MPEIGKAFPKYQNGQISFKFGENLEFICGKCCWRARSYSPATFPFKSQIFSKKKKIKLSKISFFSTGGFKLGCCDVFNRLFPFQVFQVIAHNL